jgi:hypothetical protein
LRLQRSLSSKGKLHFGSRYKGDDPFCHLHEQDLAGQMLRVIFESAFFLSEYLMLFSSLVSYHGYDPLIGCQMDSPQQ